MNAEFDCDIRNPECFSAATSDPWETDYAALVPRFTGGVSAISSALIIYIIMRSDTRLSTIYHRIMFGMSLTDIIGSIAMALTTLPMPSYMPKEEVFGYKWAGTRLGNTYSCNAQGFFSTFGMASVLMFDTMLCVYYACAIAFTMKEKNIEKYLEPIIHCLPIVFGLGFAVPPLFLEMYNPTISSFAWCGFWVYPSECLNYDERECIRGNRDLLVVALYMFFVLIPLNFVIIVVSLLLVVHKVIQTDRTLTAMTILYKETADEEIQNIRLKNGRSKAVLVQAISYISSFLLAFTLPFLNALDHLLSVGNNTHDDGRKDGVNVGIDRVLVFLFPLQGFFNFIIFISFKVYNYRRICKDASICSILRRLFTSSAHDPTFISRISIVKISERDPRCENSSFDVDMSDEMDDDCRFRIGLLMLTRNNASGVITNYRKKSPLAGASSESNRNHHHDTSSSSHDDRRDDINCMHVYPRTLKRVAILPKVDEDVSISNFDSLQSVEFVSNSSISMESYQYYGVCLGNSNAEVVATISDQNHAV